MTFAGLPISCHVILWMTTFYQAYDCQTWLTQPSSDYEETFEGCDLYLPWNYAPPTPDPGLAAISWIRNPGNNLVVSVIGGVPTYGAGFGSRAEIVQNSTTNAGLLLKDISPSLADDKIYSVTVTFVGGAQLEDDLTISIDSKTGLKQNDLELKIGDTVVKLPIIIGETAMNHICVDVASTATEQSSWATLAATPLNQGQVAVTLTAPVTGFITWDFLGNNCTTDAGLVCSKDITVSQSATNTPQLEVYIDYGSVIIHGYVSLTIAATTTTTTTTTTKPPTTLRDPCVDHEPCLNGGNCHPTDPYNAVCNCTDNYSGVQCQISGCDTKICNNGGTCYNTASTAFCTCLSCWTGDDCSIYSGTNNPCVPSPCIHGSCSVDCTFLYQCKCSVNYQGRNCSQKFDKINEQGYRYAPLLGSNLTLSLTTNETTELWWSRTENGSPLTVRKTGKSFPLVFSPVYFANGTRLYRCAQITPYVQCKVVNIYPTYDWDLEEPKPEANTSTSTVVRAVRIGEHFKFNCTIAGRPSPYKQWWRNSTVNGSTEMYKEYIGNASTMTATLAFDPITTADITMFFCSAWYLDVTPEIFVTLNLILDDGAASCVKDTICVSIVAVAYCVGFLIGIIGLVILLVKFVCCAKEPTKKGLIPKTTTNKVKLFVPAAVGIIIVAVVLIVVAVLLCEAKGYSCFGVYIAGPVIIIIIIVAVLIVYFKRFEQREKTCDSSDGKGTSGSPSKHANCSTEEKDRMASAVSRKEIDAHVPSSNTTESPLMDTRMHHLPGVRLTDPEGGTPRKLPPLLAPINKVSPDDDTDEQEKKRRRKKKHRRKDGDEHQTENGHVREGDKESEDL